jgi:hypothetical protein
MVDEFFGWRAFEGEGLIEAAGGCGFGKIVFPGFELAVDECDGVVGVAGFEKIGEPPGSEDDVELL